MSISIKQAQKLLETYETQLKALQPLVEEKFSAENEKEAQTRSIIPTLLDNLRTISAVKVGEGEEAAHDAKKALRALVYPKNKKGRDKKGRDKKVTNLGYLNSQFENAEFLLDLQRDIQAALSTKPEVEHTENEAFMTEEAEAKASSNSADIDWAFYLKCGAFAVGLAAGVVMCAVAVMTIKPLLFVAGAAVLGLTLGLFATSGNNGGAPEAKETAEDTADAEMPGQG